MGMCVLYRKRGESIKVRDPEGNIYSVRLDGFIGDRVNLTVNGLCEQVCVGESVYLDEREIAMAVMISMDGSLRIGIDAPRSWDIAREEVPFRN